MFNAHIVHVKALNCKTQLGCGAKDNTQMGCRQKGKLSWAEGHKLVYWKQVFKQRQTSSEQHQVWLCEEAELRESVIEGKRTMFLLMGGLLSSLSSIVTRSSSKSASGLGEVQPTTAKCKGDAPCMIQRHLHVGHTAPSANH